MDSNTITNPTGGMVKSAKLSHLTYEQLLRQMELDRAEEHVLPYIVDMTKQLSDEQPIISVDGSCICSRGNISAICGEAKSKKTFLASALVASAMAIPYNKLNNFKNVAKDMDINVLWIDTEQGERHVRMVIERINRLCLSVCCMRIVSYSVVALVTLSHCHIVTRRTPCDKCDRCDKCDNGDALLTALFGRAVFLGRVGRMGSCG